MQTIPNKYPFASATLLLTSLVFPGTAHADVAACGCYCGIVLRPPCGEEACKRACGYQEPAAPPPSESTPAYDYEAERQRQLEADQQRQQELDEERRHRETADRERREEFERKKQETLKSMKGITEHELGLKGLEADEPGLKGVGETGGPLKEAPRARKPQHRKQASEGHCTEWMLQTSGCHWRTCVDSRGHQYCEQCCGNSCSRVKCQ